MREIKFELIWGLGDTISKSILTIDQIVNGEFSVPKTRRKGFIYKFELIAKRQYTGLKDCNGVEIYEGDILRCADDYLWVVAFNDRGSFIAHEPKDNLVFLMIDDCDFEVIGNIHQNPELLERTHA